MCESRINSGIYWMRIEGDWTIGRKVDEMISDRPANDYWEVLGSEVMIPQYGIEEFGDKIETPEKYRFVYEKQEEMHR
jgi:hypothetical protein